MSRIAEHLEPIEQAARDMAKYAKGARNAGYEHDLGLQRNLLVSMFSQLEVLRMRCATLRSDAAYKELWK